MEKITAPRQIKDVHGNIYTWLTCAEHIPVHRYESVGTGWPIAIHEDEIGPAGTTHGFQFYSYAQ